MQRGVSDFSPRSPRSRPLTQWKDDTGTVSFRDLEELVSGKPNFPVERKVEHADVSASRRFPELGGLYGAVLQARGRHTATVIFLHGVADSGPNWIGTLESLQLPHVKYVLPTAPTRHLHITRKLHKTFRAWADVRSTKVLQNEDEDGYLVSAARVLRMLHMEVAAGIAPERIVLGGFSQGGAITATALLRSGLNIGGAFFLSSWLPLADRYPEQYTTGSSCREVLICSVSDHPPSFTASSYEQFSIMFPSSSPPPSHMLLPLKGTACQHVLSFFVFARESATEKSRARLLTSPKRYWPPSTFPSSLSNTSTLDTTSKLKNSRS